MQWWGLSFLLSLLSLLEILSNYILIYFIFSHLKYASSRKRFQTTLKFGLTIALYPGKISVLSIWAEVRVKVELIIILCTVAFHEDSLDDWVQKSLVSLSIRGQYCVTNRPADHRHTHTRSSGTRIRCCPSQILHHCVHWLDWRTCFFSPYVTCDAQWGFVWELCSQIILRLKINMNWCWLMLQYCRFCRTDGWLLLWDLLFLSQQSSHLLVLESK